MTTSSSGIESRTDETAKITTFFKELICHEGQVDHLHGCEFSIHWPIAKKTDVITRWIELLQSCHKFEVHLVRAIPIS